MRFRKNPGWLTSVAAHGALLLAILLGFSQARHVDDPHEAVPVEVVDGRELDQVMKGEKAAPSIKPRPLAEKRADVAEPKPLPALAEAAKDVAPAPAKRQPEPGQDPAKEESKPPQKAAAIPPPRPEPKPRHLEQAAAEPPHAPPKPQKLDDAEPLEPKPVPKPKAVQKVEPKPEPPKETKPVVAKKPEPRFEPDRLAKLLEEEKRKDPVEKPAERRVAKPRSSDEATPPEKRFDPTDISKFLSRDAPQRKASAGPELQQLAALGAPTASAAKMSPSLWGALDGLLQEQYKRCWTFIGLGSQKKYIPEIQVQFAEDGSLARPPELLNPPSDPNLKALAESALRAVRRCNPLHIPARYQPYYEQWKGRIVRFDPEEML